MTFKIYDYDNHFKLIDLPIREEEISQIKVRVLTGDEKVEIVTKNGEIFTFDSSERRFIDYFDGEYLIDEPQMISDWLHWEPTEKDTRQYFTKSYRRLSNFRKISDQKI